MSNKNTQKTGKKVVPIKESQLVDLIDNLVNEVVETKKTEWLAEQKAKNTNLLESKVARLEKLVSELTKK
jgi:hypothetical protein